MYVWKKPVSVNYTPCLVAIKFTFLDYLGFFINNLEDFCFKKESHGSSPG